ENMALIGVLRGVCHFTSPLFVSSAAIDGSLAPSQLTTSRSFTSAGDPAFPCTEKKLSFVCVQRIFPARSSAAVPRCPKCTYSRSPLTIGVGLAYEFFSCLMLGTAGR